MAELLTITAHSIKQYHWKSQESEWTMDCQICDTNGTHVGINLKK